MYRLAPNLTLPANAATDTYAALGTRGSGKSYFVGRMVEVLNDAGTQVVVIDPCGIWYGLRLAADGRGPGIDIPVLGGWHGDIPLEPTAGELVAKLVAERRMSAVLDVSEFTGGQQHRFVRDFARALFDLKKRNRSPLHVVLEEAHEFLPQQVGPGEAEMVGVVKRLWKIGRNFGIGGTLVTQRAAEINKGALNLTEVMICGKLKGPQDKKAIAGWARDQDADETHLDELATLPSGTMFVWRDSGCLKVRVDQKRTFDASKTPEAGDKATAQALPKIDLAIVRAEMAATIEEAKANDPKALRERIAELEARAPVAAPAQIQRVETERIVHRVPEQQPELVRVLAEHLSSIATGIEVMSRDMRGAQSAMGSIARLTREAAASPTASNGTSVHVPTPMHVEPARTPATMTYAPAADSGDGAMRMLRALAARHPTPLTEQQVAVLSGLKRKGGTYRTYRGKLTGGGLITKDGHFLRLTDAGLWAAGNVARPASGAEMLAVWRDRFTGKARDILELYAASGETIPKADAIRRVGLDPAGGTARTYWGQLTGAGLLERTSGGFRAVESLRLR